MKTVAGDVLTTRGRTNKQTDDEPQMDAEGMCPKFINMSFKQIKTEL